jgi:hypothetical protein
MSESGFDESVADRDQRKFRLIGDGELLRSAPVGA